MAPTPKFVIGEKVLCFHGPLLYEAKCLQSQVKERYVEYFVHYNGWNKNWDEWVPEIRVLKFNETNVQKQKELAEAQKTKKKSKTVRLTFKKDAEKDVAGPSTSDTIPVQQLAKKLGTLAVAKKEVDKATSEPSTSSGKTSSLRAEKRPGCAAALSSDQVQKSKKGLKVIKNENLNLTSVKVTMPDVVKEWLLDDRDLIIHQEKIVQLPAQITVDQIFASYVKEKVSTKTLTKAQERSVVFFSENMRALFNVSLGKSLLYKFERPQYGQLLKDHKGKKMCELYGAIHLVRLLCHIGEMLVSAGLGNQDKAHIKKFVEPVEDMLRFMASNEYFSEDDYVVASPEYIRKTLT
ncbi:mortality factor 4-like protein 1 [Caerostris darwini]|uniref:Mortality factor 4-like protein 1 n=1 Tax=Caerostris darwini TaxID=1538125 RepID=A0AAV4TSQ2_9ARAC|nr:mortality factor 4-like protein 1 [Caerostris darwini]